MNPGAYSCGWVPNASVGWILDESRAALAHAEFVYVASLDSEPFPGRLPLARLIAPDAVVSSEPFVVTGQGLIALLDNEQVFTGFDEIWWLGRPPDGARPRRVSLVTPPPRQRIDPEMSTWLEEADVLLGVGDGEGLNFVIRSIEPWAAAIVEKIESSTGP